TGPAITGPGIRPSGWLSLLWDAACRASKHCRNGATPPRPATLLCFVGWVDSSWIQSEAGVGQEPDDQVLVLADPLEALCGGVGHGGQGGTREVGQLEVLEVGPQILDWVELGSVGGE